jgi:hypothetical protein
MKGFQSISFPLRILKVGKHHCNPVGNAKSKLQIFCIAIVAKCQKLNTHSEQSSAFSDKAILGIIPRFIRLKG